MSKLNLEFLNPELLNNSYFVSALMAMFVLSSLLYISQLLKQEKRRTQREKETELEDQTRRDFLSNINHEIRTPVNVISGMLHLLMQQNLDKPSMQYAEKIKVANSDIKSVIDDALDFNRLHSGDINTNEQEVNIFNLIKSLQDKFSPIAKQKNLSLSFRVDKSIPRRILVDEYLLKSVLSKLIDNSIKFTEKGGVEIKIEIGQGNDSAIEVVFKVSDTGIGMSQEQARSKIRAFRQGERSNVRNYGGIGVGLFLVKKMLDSMKSDLIIATKLGEGTRMSFNLVLNYMHEDLSDADICKGKKIMFVDDDIINRKIGETLLQKLEASPTVLSSGQEALDNVDGTYDLLIIDIKMPGMDGTEVAEKIHAKGFGKIPIIALTGNSDAEDLEEYKHHGMVGCIAKPIDFDVMKGSIADVFKSNKSDLSFKKIDKNNINTDSEIKRFDPSKGLRLINGDQELYNSILEKFRVDFADVPSKLYKFMEARDLKTCENFVHSIKSVAMNMGAAPLSGLAKDLEMKFRSGKRSDISEFEAELKVVIEDISKYLTDNAINIAPAGEKKSGGIDELKKLLQDLKEDVQRYDPIKSKEGIAEIKTYSFADVIADSVNKLAKAIAAYDFATATQVIEEMEANLKE